jgi:hypothetical protein
MSKVLKWILYVVLGLVVLAVVAGIVFAIFGGVGHGYYMMRPGFRMMEPYRYSYFNSGRMIFGGLLGLGIFILIIVGIVALVSVVMRRDRPAQVSQTTQPTLSTQPTPLAQPAPAAETAAPTRTCSNCGKPAQDDWQTCPYCGNPLT